MKMTEEWKAIPGFDGKYLVSNMGRVLNVNNGLKKPYVTKKGYLKVGLSNGRDHYEKRRVHRLVAEAFLPNPDGLPEVNHKDLNKTNNVVTNLEWVTGEENRRHYMEMKGR